MKLFDPARSFVLFFVTLVLLLSLTAVIAGISTVHAAEQAEHPLQDDTALNAANEDGHITGMVTDGAVSLPNIEVRIYKWNGDNFYWKDTTATDGSGAYDASDLEPGIYRLKFHDPAYIYLSEFYDDAPDLASATSLTVVSGSSVTGIDAELVSYSHITGTVSDGTNPLPDVQVIAVRWTGTYYNWEQSAQTDALGAYDIGRLPAGIYRLHFNPLSDAYFAEYYNDAPDLDRATDVVVAASSTISGIDAVLTEGGHITGHVSAASSPLQGIRVSLYKLTSGEYQSIKYTFTDASGNYDLAGLLDGTYRIRFTNYYYNTEYYDNAQDLASATDIAAVVGSTTAGVDAVLAELGHIAGTVTDGLNPLPNIEVKVYYWNGRSYERWYSTDTDAAGKYNIGGMPAGNYRVGFFDSAGVYLTEFYDDAPDLDSADDIAVALDATVSGIDAVLDKRGRITGSVSDGSNPLANIEVAAYQWTGYGYDRIASTHSDGSGRYDLGGLTEGTYRVGFSGSNSEYLPEYYDDMPDLDSASDIPVTRGATTANINAVLTKGGQIDGSVTNGTDPLPDTEIIAYRWTGSEYQWAQSTITDGSGNYVVSGLLASTYRLKFSHYDYIEEYYDNSPDLFGASDISVNLGETVSDIDAVLASWGHISGNVSASAGPLAGIEAAAYRKNGSYWDYASGDSTDSSGHYDIGRLATGIYRVEFSVPWDSTYLTEWYDNAPDRESASDVSVTAGATTANIDATLSEGGKITGIVTDGANPLLNIGVHVYRWNGSGYDWLRSTNTDPLGKYTFSGLATGTYRVRFNDDTSIYSAEYYDDAPDLDSATDIDVTAGSTSANIDAVLSPMGQISGTVTDGLNPLPNVRIAAYRWTGTYFAQFAYTYTGTTGSYNIGGLAAGTYRLRFSAEGYLTEFYDDAPDLDSGADISVAAGSTASGVNAVLSELGHITGSVSNGSNPLQSINVSFLRWNGAAYEQWGSANTNAVGKYDQGNLPAGSYLVKFTDYNGKYVTEYYDGAPSTYSATAVTVALGSTTSGIDAVLTERGHISGTVTDGTKPLPGITIEIYRWNGHSFESYRFTSTNAAGEYDQGSLPAGTYRVRFSSSLHLAEYYDDAPDLGRAADISVSDGSMTAGIDAILTEGGRITGSVTNGTNPISDIEVIAHRWTGSAYEKLKSAHTDSSGRYEIAALPGGSYRVEFTDSYGVYPGEYYDDAPDLHSAADVAVKEGQATAGINAILVGRGYITIAKDTGTATEGSFFFEGDFGSFSLAAGESKLFRLISEGDYTISEKDSIGWVLEDITCNSDQISEQDQGVTIHLLAGDDITCTFNNRRLTVKADAGGPYKEDEGAPVALNASATTRKELVKWYKWDCTANGTWDVTTANPQGSSCTYADNGVYTVRLRTVDIFGQTSSDTAKVTVSNIAPQVNAGSDLTVMIGREARFAGSFFDPGTADTHTIKWDFGDGSKKWATLTPTHIYTKSGQYTVTLTVTDDDGGKGSAALTVDVVNSAPSMGSVTVSPATIDEGQSFTLSGTMNDASEGSALSLLVDWGDGQLETKEFAPGADSFGLNHSCDDDPPGAGSGDTYTITLTLSDDEGAYTNSTAVVTVHNLPPTVSAGPDQTIDQGQPLTFSAAISDPGLLDTHTVTWDFGDGRPTASGPVTAHSFSEPGVYTVTVTAEDDDGGLGQDTLSVTVKEIFRTYAPLILQQ